MVCFMPWWGVVYILEQMFDCRKGHISSFHTSIAIFEFDTEFDETPILRHFHHFSPHQNYHYSTLKSLQTIENKAFHRTQPKNPIFNNKKRLANHWKTDLKNSSNTSNNESSSSSDSSTAEDKTSAYNESIYQPESQTIKSGTANGSKNSSSESSGSSSSSNESSNSENTESTSEDKRQSTNTYNRTNQQDSNYTKGTTNGKTEDNSIRGLNGLFTTQQLIKQEREIAEFNVYQWIVTKYMEELFICVF